MPLSAADYRPRDAEHAVLYRVIAEHLDALLETAKRHADGAALPGFVEQEFRDFLTCGVLAHGFARLRCADCALERLVPFSCKGRGFCPSCGGRRMTECAARLVDGVLPRVPVRQWVLSLPYRLRYLLAWDHGLARAVLRVAVRVLLSFQRHRARRYGIRDGRSGCVTVIQRFGGGLNFTSLKERLIAAGMLTDPQIAAQLGVRRTTIGRWRREGRLEARICNEMGQWLYAPQQQRPPDGRPPSERAAPGATDNSLAGGAV